MIEVESYPVMQYNRLTGKECVVVKVNSHKRLMDVQTVDGLVFYRLSASNYRLPTERIYRNGEVQGLVRSIQMQFEEVIRTQHATIKQLQEKHKEELHTLLEEERKKAIALTSEILYKAHRTMPESASQEDRPKWWEFWTRCFGWAAGYTDADDVSETSSEIVDPKPQDPSPLADLEELPSNNTEPLASPS
jgi:hypothetical protein